MPSSSGHAATRASADPVASPLPLPLPLPRPRLAAQAAAADAAAAEVTSRSGRERSRFARFARSRAPGQPTLGHLSLLGVNSRPDLMVNAKFAALKVMICAVARARPPRSPSASTAQAQPDVRLGTIARSRVPAGARPVPARADSLAAPEPSFAMATGRGLSRYGKRPRQAASDTTGAPDIAALVVSGGCRQVTMANCTCNCTVVCVANVYLVAYNSLLPDSAECLNKQRTMGYDFRAPVAQGKRRAP